MSNYTFCAICGDDVGRFYAATHDGLCRCC